MSFTFVYHEMFDGYYQERNNEGYFENSEDVICFMIHSTKKYESASKKQKKNILSQKLSKGQGYLGAFIKDNIDKDHIRKIKFIDDQQVFPSGRLMYPMGLYLILNPKFNSMFIVYPTPKINDMNEEIICSDHYSFMYNQNDKNNQVHLHITEYQPSKIHNEIGMISHLPYHFSDNIQLPLEGYNCHVFKKMKILKHDILDLCRFHIIHKLNGGGKTKHRKSREKAKQEISKILERVLLEKEIKSVKAIGCKYNDKWHMTVQFEWDEKEDIDDEINDDDSIITEDYSDANKKDMAIILNKPTFASFQSELIKRLSDS